MPNDNVVRLIQPGAFDDQLTDVLRNGARALLAQAVEAEVAGFLAKHAECKTEDGRKRVVRHGHLPEREVMTGIGPVAVKQPRVRDRGATADDPGRIRFSPAILPPYICLLYTSVVDQRVGRPVGSDHLPLWSAIRLPAKPTIMAGEVEGAGNRE